MTEFLDGKDLADKIREVVTGDNVKCAVAFWGKDMAAELGVKPDWKFICDVKMGGTSADALRALGAPNNKNLRHIEYLHAKVYISSVGVVIGSANASFNALGLGSREPKLTEVGVFYEPMSKLWKKANEWFDDLLWDGAEVDDKVIAEAERTYTPPHHDLPDTSLLDLIQRNIKIFDELDFRFLIASEWVLDPTKAARDSVEAAVQRSGEDFLDKAGLSKVLINWPENRLFEGWPVTTTLGPGHFFEFFVRKAESERAVVIHELREGYSYTNEGKTNFYTHEADAEILKLVSGSLGLGENRNWSNVPMNDDDWKVITKIRDDYCEGYRRGIFTPQKFANLITKARGDLKQA